MSRMRAAGTWLRWEMGRRIEMNGVIRLIIVERFAKGLTLVFAGIVLLVVSGRVDLRDLADRLQEQGNLSPGRGLLQRLWEQTLARLGALSQRQQDAIGMGALLYGALEITEGGGLILRRRWAEYLVLVATAAFIPLEVDELVRRATVFKALALLVNLAIAGYLVWRKRLFLERRGRGGPA